MFVTEIQVPIMILTFFAFISTFHTHTHTHMRAYALASACLAGCTLRYIATRWGPKSSNLRACVFSTRDSWGGEICGTGAAAQPLAHATVVGAGTMLPDRVEFSAPRARALPSGPVAWCLHGAPVAHHEACGRRATEHEDPHAPQAQRNTEWRAKKRHKGPGLPYRAPRSKGSPPGSAPKPHPRDVHTLTRP